MTLRTCIQECTSGTIGLRLVVQCATHFLARDGIKELTAHVTSATHPPFCNHVCRYEVACTDMWENEICWCYELICPLPSRLPVQGQPFYIFCTRGPITSQTHIYKYHNTATSVPFASMYGTHPQRHTHIILIVLDHVDPDQYSHSDRPLNCLFNVS